MNEGIRDWIKNNRQPWFKSIENASKLNDYAKHYFTRINKNIENKSYEELLDDELIEIYNVLISNLTKSEKEKIDKYVAIGYCRTYEPNACCLKRPEGYAVLFDQFFDSLLIALTEQYFATFDVEPSMLSINEYIVYSNNTILSVFFGASLYIEPIDLNKFPYREDVNKWIYTITLFILAHEIAHFVLNHLDDENLRNLFGKSSNIDDNLIYNKNFQQEFDADKWAIEFVLQNTIQLIIDKDEPSAKDESIFWGWLYIRIGWFFSILGSIEIISERIKLPIVDTHPSALMRWERISKVILEKKKIHPDSIKLFETMKYDITISAEEGRFLQLDYSLMDDLLKTRINYQKN